MRHFDLAALMHPFGHQEHFVLTALMRWIGHKDYFTNSKIKPLNCQVKKKASLRAVWKEHAHLTLPVPSDGDRCRSSGVTGGRDTEGAHYRIPKMWRFHAVA